MSVKLIDYIQVVYILNDFLSAYTMLSIENTVKSDHNYELSISLCSSISFYFMYFEDLLVLLTFITAICPPD